MAKNAKKRLFVLYVLLVGIALLYMLFPSDAIRSFIVNRIERVAPDLQISFEDLKPAFPLAVSMKNLIVSKEETVIFSADQLTLQPRWMSLVTSNKEVKFQAIAYQGQVSGIISLAQHSETGRFSINGNFSELLLDQIPVLQEKLDMGLSGRVSGQFHFDEVSEQQALGGGEFFVTDCTVIPSVSILEMDRLNFQRIHLKLALEGNKLELQQSDFQGSEIDATLSGSIIFKSPTDRSVLDLDIIVTPRRLFSSKSDEIIPAGLPSSALSEKDKINFRVTGSLGTPTVALGAAH